LPLDAAILYATQGRCVFALAPGSKAPRKGSAGFCEATNAEKTIRQWWTETPDANVGIATGKGSGLFVVDLDVDKAKNGIRTWQQLEKQHGKAAATYTVQTPRDGRHLYFKIPDAHIIPCSTGKLGEGIDVRGDGGYVVAPPSTVNGRAYKVLNAAAPAMPPAWIIEAVRAKPEKLGTPVLPNSAPSLSDLGLTKSGSLDTAKLENVQHLPDGSTRAACPACRAAGEDHTGNHLLIQPDGKFGCAKQADDHAHRQRIWELAGSKATAAPLPPIIDACDFIAQPLTQPPELIKGILHQGSKLAIGGGSKSFKTWTLLDLALSVAHGRNWLAHETTQGSVIYLNFEIQPWSWQRRISAVAAAKGITPEPGRLSLWNLRGKAANYNLLLPQIREQIKDRFALVILDPIYKLYGKTDENRAHDVAELLNAIEDLCVETGAATAFGAHFSKGNQASKESIDRISGSGVFARDPDSLLIFTKHETEDAFTVEATLRNFPPVDPFVVRWQYPLMAPDATLDPAKLKQAAGRKPEHSPDDLLRLLPPSGSLNKDWLDTADGEGISRRTFFRLKKTLEQQDRIAQDPVTLLWRPLNKGQVP